MHTPDSVNSDETSAASEASAHTPTPWAVSSSTMLVALDDKRDLPIIGNLIDLMGVSSIGINEARANAEFIVRAVNSHNRLVCALVDLVNYIEVYKTAGWSISDQRMVRARAALALAKDGQK